MYELLFFFSGGGGRDWGDQFVIDLKEFFSLLTFQSVNVLIFFFWGGGGICLLLI